VLVADDGEANRKLLQLVLGRAGMTVVAVENGQEAVNAARSQDFDVILMDMQMPIMDGYTATTTLRTDGCTLPIIALTAHVMQSDEMKCRDAGCSGYLSKPINMDALFEVVAEQMGARSDAKAESPATTELANAHESDAVVESQSASRDVTVSNQQEGVDGSSSPGVVPVARPSRGSNTSPPLDAEVEAVTTEVFQAMRESLSKNDFTRLVSLSKSLHEVATVFGLQKYVLGTTQLELAARHKQADDCRTIIADLIKQSSRSKADENNSVKSTGASVETSTAARSEDSRDNDSPHITEPLTSSLPMDDREFHELVVEYVTRHKERVDAMLECWENRDLETLGEHAHWLKGSAGTAGFGDFTPVAEKLMAAVRSREEDLIGTLLGDIETLTNRIDIEPLVERVETDASDARPAEMSREDLLPAEPNTSETEGPIHSTLPTDDAEFCEIVVEFIEKLRVKLEMMQSAFDAGQWTELGSYAHWMKGSGGTAGFHDLTSPARALEEAVKSRDVASAKETLTMLRSIVSRIAVPELAASVV